MKKNNKGISLVSLVVIIIATIILISVVVTVGYNYIEESNRTKTKAIVALVSDAAKNLQNEKHIEAESIYYVGHPLRSDAINNLKGVPDDFASKVVPESMWYLIDANSAEKLGILDASKYLEVDLKNPKEGNDVVKAVLVNYNTGEAYLVEIDRTFLGGTIENSICNGSGDGSHQYSIRTCNKGSFCIKCGLPNSGENSNPYGHEYSMPTCTAAAICIRCNEIDPDQPATGHRFEINESTGNEIWTTDATRHWKECTVEGCGAKKETASHDKGYVRIELASSKYDPQYHKEVCSTCGWESVKTEHKIKYEVTADKTHRRFCELCEYSEEHGDSGWIITDAEYHWRECEDGCEDEKGNRIDCIVGNKLFYDKHKDENSDKVCDTCQKVLDTMPPNAFTSDNVKVLETTTNIIKVSAVTEDETGIKGYKFAIDENRDGIIDWDSVQLIEKEEGAAEKVFTNLEDNTLYAIYVIAMDKGNNVTPQYQIPNTKTKKVPNVKINGIPEGSVSKEFIVSFEIDNTDDPTLDITNMLIEYSIDGEKTWIEENSLNIEKEEVDLRVRAKDDRKEEPNTGDITKKVINSLDKTAPIIKIMAKEGDDPSILKTVHTAVVTLKDDKTKINPGTTIRYAWSLSNTTPPTTYNVATTTNTSLNESGIVEITTPSGGVGEYYLWIDKGVEDAGNNKTTEAICSTIKFNIDDAELTVSNIRMYNPNPEITSQSGYVKTNGTVAVTFSSGKELSKAPTVNVGGIVSDNVTSTDNINWTATVIASSEMTEGPLSLNISNIVSVAGKTAVKEYTQSDLVEGPVIYDKTLPELEYIEK